MGVGIVDDIRKCVTADIKVAGNPIYLVGETKPELGGSAYLEVAAGSSATVPRVDFEMLSSSINAMLGAISAGHVASCHDVSDGGLAVCAAEMCIGSGIGVSLDISKFGLAGKEEVDARSDFKLFSESPTRWLIEVRKGEDEAFLSHFKNIPAVRLGYTGSDTLVIKDSNGNGEGTGEASPPIVSLSVDELRKSWESPIHKYMGDTVEEVDK